VGIGLPIVALAAVLSGRFIWEETVLTLKFGPQMIGFSLAHGAGAILLLTPLLLALWFVVALLVLAVSLLRKRSLSKWYWATFASAVLAGAALSIPEEFWQWLLIDRFAKSAHSADLMCYTAAEGNVRTVRAYLERGVPIEATNYGGSTAMFTAAAGGSVPVLQALLAKGAKINATNFYGDSPLDAAVQNNHPEAIAFLKAHGASQIHGMPEQREAASEAIVRKEMYRPAPTE